MPSPAPRTLSEDLRARSDEALVQLLLERPDLAVPPPGDLTALATRAAGRGSVHRAIENLDLPGVQVLEVLAALPEPATETQVKRGFGGDVQTQLEDLRTRGLVWGGPRSLRLVRAARDAVGPFPAGLGPPLAEALDRRSPQRIAELAEDLGLPPSGDPETTIKRIADHLGTPETLEKLLAVAPAGARDLLERLTWGPPVGAVADADRQVRPATAASPLEWLLAHGLLAVADAGHVVLPRETAVALRGGRITREPSVAPPPVAVRERSARAVDATGAGTASEAIRLVDALLELWETEPAPPLRTGGLGVRELRRVATVLEVDEPTAALVVETAHSAGLVADDAELDPRWTPTLAVDHWRDLSAGERWQNVAEAWLTASRAASLVGSRDARDSPRAALSPDVESPAAPVLRRWVLDELLTLAGALDGEPGVQDLLARLDRSAPRRASAGRHAQVRAALKEAAWLGITALGALTAHGRALLETRDPEDAAPAAALDVALPPPVEEVLLQADLTAVAPGPLTPELSRLLAGVADVESRGGATVYRFTPGSVRRALDAGRSAAELLDALTRASRTGVPQPLTYLIEDSARRFGKVRVAAAQAFVRADDESALAEIMADRRSAGLRLRRIAPTVLAAQAPVANVLAVLREIGMSPAAESAEGDLVIRRPERHRTDVRPRASGPPPRPTAPVLAGLVRTLRAADVRNPPGAGSMSSEEVVIPRLPPNELFQILREAIAGRRVLRIGVADALGGVATRTVEPLSIEGGRLNARDRTDGAVRTYSVHRITGAVGERP